MTTWDYFFSAVAAFYMVIALMAVTFHQRRFRQVEQDIVNILKTLDALAAKDELQTIRLDNHQRQIVHLRNAPLWKS